MFIYNLFTDKLKNNFGGSVESLLVTLLCKLEVMADPHNVEFEAAKFLQKLIHESTDEPAKLATKLYVVSGVCLSLVSSLILVVFDMNVNKFSYL